MATPLRVLILEDSPADAELLVAELRRAGFDPVWHRADGEIEYLDRLDSALDLILADYSLPQFDAPRALKLLQERGFDIPFIVVSGTVVEDAAVDCLHHGAADYLLKDRLTRLGPAVTSALRGKELRDETQRAHAALRESEERYRLITETIHDALFLVDLEGRVLFANSRARELSGYDGTEVAGHSLLTLLTPEGVQEVQARLAALQGGQPVPPVLEVELVRKDGGHRWVEVSFASVVRDGTTVARLGVARDVTERKEAEAAQTRLQVQLAQREKIAAMGELLAGVAHELNNPLSVVIGQTDLLRRAVGEGPVAVRAGKIAQAAERCARIVRQFLALARQHPPERRRILLNQVVEEALDLMAYPLRVDTITVTRELAPDLPALWADPHQLHQVVVNLVTNAHHALRQTPLPRGIRVTTHVDAATQRVSLEVADTGPGIPLEVQARIFEPFFTTKAQGQGTGLGLSLCQGIVEAHGGSIGATSVPGEGALFRVELPVVALAPAGPGPMGETDEPPVQGKAVLVVDDERDVAEVLRDMLLQDGHRVDVAANGADALARLAKHPYDLVLSDMRMPELDGPGLYREASRRQPDLARRFVFLTGDSLTPETHAFLRATDQPNLSKPFDLDEVRRVVRRALRG